MVVDGGCDGASSPSADSCPHDRSAGDSMTPSADRPAIQIEADGRTLASAEVHPTDEPGLVHSDMHVESGHVPTGTGTRLVDAVLEHPEVEEADRLLATMPLGDTEVIDRVRARRGDVEARAAGATKVGGAQCERDHCGQGQAA